MEEQNRINQFNVIMKSQPTKLKIFQLDFKCMHAQMNIGILLSRRYVCINAYGENV